MEAEIQSLIDRLEMTEHPEGGYYKETFVADDTITRPDGETRPSSTAIHYLLRGTDFSAFHRLQSNETWHYCSGTSLTIHIIQPDGELQSLKLGNSLLHEGANFQVIVGKGKWFCAKPDDPDSYTLASCIVSPGFIFDDFELANADELCVEYPQHTGLITRFCRVVDGPGTEEEENEGDATSPRSAGCR